MKTAMPEVVFQIREQARGRPDGEIEEREERVPFEGGRFPNEQCRVILRSRRLLSVDIALPANVESLWGSMSAKKYHGGRVLRSFKFAPTSEITEIPSMYFEGCDKLEEVTLPDKVETIGRGAFVFCTKLPTVLLPARVREIKAYAFAHCHSLRSVQFSNINSVHSIGESAFMFCKILGFDSAFDVPPNVRRIETKTFKGCTGLHAVNFPPTLEFIGFLAFTESGLLSIDLSGASPLPDAGPAGGGAGAFMISNKAFAMCVLLRSVKLPPNLSHISEECFFGCKRLTDITIPDSVTVIYGCAFQDCRSLLKIRIPQSVKSICTEAFLKCTALRAVYFQGTRRTKHDWEKLLIRDPSRPEGVHIGMPNQFLDCPKLGVFIFDNNVIIDLLNAAEFEPIEGDPRQRFMMKSDELAEWYFDIVMGQPKGLKVPALNNDWFTTMEKGILAVNASRLSFVQVWRILDRAGALTPNDRRHEAHVRLALLKGTHSIVRDFPQSAAQRFRGQTPGLPKNLESEILMTHLTRLFDHKPPVQDAKLDELLGGRRA